MIPLTAEDEWLVYLKGLSYWSPPLHRTLILSPHPDDETLGAGGLIATLCAEHKEVNILAISDGENAYQDRRNLAYIRRKEQVLALKKLGITGNNIKRLGFTDGDVQRSEKALEQAILSLLDSKTHIIAPWLGDFHPDHEVTGKVATKIAEMTDAKLSYYFFWTWHRATIAGISHLPLAIYPLSQASYQLKQKALGCYLSQLKHSTGQPILPYNLLVPSKRTFEVYCDYKPR